MYFCNDPYINACLSIKNLLLSSQRHALSLRTARKWIDNENVIMTSLFTLLFSRSDNDRFRFWEVQWKRAENFFFGLTNKVLFTVFHHESL